MCIRDRFTSKSKRAKVRDELVEKAEEVFGKLWEESKKVKKRSSRYVLQYQIWRGPIQVRFGPSDRVWRLWVDSGDRILQFSLFADPTKHKSVAGVPTRFKDAKSLMGLGASGREEVKPGTALNPTKATKSFIEVVTAGGAEVLEDEGEVKKVEFKSGELKGVWLFVKERPEAVSYTHLTLPTICSV